MGDLRVLVKRKIEVFDYPANGYKFVYLRHMKNSAFEGFQANEEDHSTERFDASTHADKMTRIESVISENAILVGVYLKGEGDSESPLDELAALADAAGTTVLGELIQRKHRPEAATYIGSGKLEELKQLVDSLNADVVIFDNDLGPAQTKNLETALKTKVLDRTELILDIFASRARTIESRLAVELAQLEYSLPRLKRMWTHLERQGVGGVGLRGPGEKQLEVDRRLAQKRIIDLKRELEAVHSRKIREVSARKSARSVCLVGYTNAGKSTLLNRLTDSAEFVKDLLFATLDTRTRRWHLPGWGPVLLSDTVGFVRNLPHHLIASFRATLEEANQADLLLHIADATHPEVLMQVAAAYKVLEEIGIREKDTLLILNKIDAVEKGQLDILTATYPNAIPVSAHSGLGIDRLNQAVSDALSREFIEIEVELPVGDGKTAAFLAREGEILEKNYDETNVRFHCRLPRAAYGKLKSDKNMKVKRLDAQEDTVPNPF